MENSIIIIFFKPSLNDVVIYFAFTDLLFYFYYELGGHILF